MSKRTDISHQIRKYLNGELNGRAMHRLERQAQDDPFVMDALEGYTTAGADQQANLDELGSRLGQKVRPATTGRIVRWRTISIAASLLGALIAIAGIWVMNDQPEKKEKKLALQEVEILKPQTAPVKPAPFKNDSATQERVVGEETLVGQPVKKGPVPDDRDMFTRHADDALRAVSESEVIADAAPQKSPDSSSLEELIVMNYKQAKQQDKNNLVAAAPADIDEAMPDKSKGVLRQQDAAKKDSEAPSFLSASKSVSGKIMDASGPLPGVRVRVNGTSISSVTDINGRFRLPLDQPKRLVLDVDMLGYLNKQVKVNSKDSIIIAMKPRQAVSGGVITGYGAEQCCWDVYEKYLKDNAISPDGKTGTVKLSFIVNPDNSLSDFNIIKGLSEETDKKAIDIIKSGPPWVHDPGGKPKKVTLKVKFSAKQ